MKTKILVIAGMMALVGCAVLPIKLIRVTRIGPTEAARLLSYGRVFVVDVGSPEAYLQEHIPSAISIPRSELRSRIDEFPRDRGVPVLIYDGNGRDSRVAAIIVRDKGYDSVYELVGGLRAWAAAELPVHRAVDRRPFQKLSFSPAVLLRHLSAEASAWRAAAQRNAGGPRPRTRFGFPAPAVRAEPLTAEAVVKTGGEAKASPPVAL